ncbi:MAG: hypothetical protein ACK5Y2_08535 [Bdellovibrionales bacterium]
MERIFLLGLLFISSFSSAQPSRSTPSSGTVLLQTVGTSAFQVVTTRDVKISSLLSQVMKTETRDWWPSSTFTQEAHATLLEIAIYREAQSLGAIKLESSETERILEKAKSQLQKTRDWKALEVSDVALRPWVERKMVADAFLDLKATSLTSIITEQEIQDYYERNRAKFGSTPLVDQRDNIRRFLQKESRQQRLQEWFTALKVKYQIRNDLTDTTLQQEPERDTSTHRK